MYVYKTVTTGSSVILVYSLISFDRSTKAIQSVRYKVVYLRCWKMNADVPYFFLFQTFTVL